MSGGSTLTATQRRVSTVSMMLSMRSPALQPQVEVPGQARLEDGDRLSLHPLVGGGQGEAEVSPNHSHPAVGRLVEAEADPLPSR